MIIYSREALADIDRLFAWLEVRSVAAAGRFVAALRGSLANIAKRPLLYPTTRDGRARKCLMFFGRAAYVIYYVIDGDDQVVVRIWHGREERR